MDVRAVSQLSRPAPRPTDVGGLFQLLRNGLPRTRADLSLLTGQARSTVAARVGARLAVTDLASTVLAEHHEALAIADGPDAVLDRVAAIASASWCSASTVEARSVTARRACVAPRSTASRMRALGEK